MGLQEFIDFNTVREPSRNSEWIEVDDIHVSALISALKAIHGTVITFSNVFLELKGVCRLKEVALKQSAVLASGELLATAGTMYLLLLNKNVLTVVKNNSIVFPSGTSEDDILAVIEIPSTAWKTYKTGYAEASVSVDKILQAHSEIENTGKNLYGILISTGAGIIFPASPVLQIKLFTEPLANANDE